MQHIHPIAVLFCFTLFATVARAARLIILSDGRKIDLVVPARKESVETTVQNIAKPAEHTAIEGRLRLFVPYDELSKEAGRDYQSVWNGPTVQMETFDVEETWAIEMECRHPCREAEDGWLCDFNDDKGNLGVLGRWHEELVGVTLIGARGCNTQPTSLGYFWYK